VTSFTAVYDACVLYPAPLRDLLLQIALTDLVRARWTEQIHDEWTTAALRNNAHLSRERLQRTRDLMNNHVRDALVTQYEPLVAGLTLPDPDDRHVFAAAIRCQAGVIVTYNLKDFPASHLEPHGIEAKHPDAFIADLFDLSPPMVTEAAKTVRSRLRNPPHNSEEYLATLERQGLAETVTLLREYINLI
jgi:predicted nucleic acid-binding protein